MVQISRLGKRLLVASLPLAVFLALATASIADDASARKTDGGLASQILDATGVRGGLIVHVGCGDGKLTAALRANESYLVHGLDTDAEKVDRARQTIRSLGAYGGASVEEFDGQHLPYVDNLVNLVVAESLGDVPMDEVMRVLCPQGVAYVRGASGWKKTSKPRGAEIDEWTHFLHDASNNAVARDTEVGPPRRLRWTCGPFWTRSHEYTSSLCAMVSGGGRLFYIFDEGLTGVTTRSVPSRWTLIARDAFNGTLLWKRRMPRWGADAWRSRALRSIPRTVPRLLVADGDRLFVTLGYGAAVSALNAATGQTLTTFRETEGTEEIRCCDGVLLLRQGKKRVIAIDISGARFHRARHVGNVPHDKNAKRLWEAGGKIQPLTMAVARGKVFFQDKRSLCCRHLTNGKELWRIPLERAATLLIAHEDRVVMLSGPEISALSAATGKGLWSVNAGVRRRELFVARGKVWHWEGDGVVGRDLRTGKLTERPDTSDVFTPGHHPRCYQSKGTENYLITPYRGVEFVSLTGGPHTQSDWVRGACAYGVMPANGLLYVPPHPCFCCPGVKLNGFNALAPAPKGPRVPEVRAATERLQRGPAYTQIQNLKSEIQNPEDWPTYRHDARRSGATGCEVPPRVATRWRLRLGGKLTPPVAAGERVYVAAKDEHTLHAIHADDGRKLWQFTAGGRIDSPPTVHGGLVLFGCADGRVRCLRAADGRLAWQFTAAPSSERIIAFGQLESPWPVHGSVLVSEGIAYFTAGRSSYLDGGIWVFALDAATGKVLHETRLDTWARTREDAKGKPFIPAYHMEGARSDILVSQGGSIFMGQVKFDRKLARQEVPYVLTDPDDKTVAPDPTGQPCTMPDEDPKANYEKHQRDWLERTQKGLLEKLRLAHGSHNLGDRQLGLHVFATSGFLDDSWFNRTYWMYSATWPGFYLAHRAPKTGQLLVVGPERTYAVQSYPSRNLQSPLFTPGEKGYLLQADDNDNEPILDHRTRGTTKGWGFARARPPAWHHWAPIRIRAMVLAGETLFVAGPPDVVDPDDPMAAFEGRQGAVLQARSAADGRVVAERKLESPPVFDGLIAADARLYLSTMNGELVCLGDATKRRALPAR